MAQNINLFDGASRKPRPRLSFVTLLYGLAGVTVLLAIILVFVQFQVNGLNGEMRRVQQLVDAERAEALKASGTAARKPDPQLEAEISKLRAELSHAHGAMAALKGESFGDRQGFAEYLRVFSRQSLDGLWLTGFTITGSGDIELKGGALRPDLVPAYVQRLGREDLLAGRSFARLEMGRPKPPAEADKGAPQAPAFLEFSLATREAVKVSEKAQ